MQLGDSHAEAVVPRKFLPERRVNRRHVRLRRFECDARLEACDDLKHRVRPVTSLKRERRPELDILGDAAADRSDQVARKVEAARHDADDRERFAVERDRFADDRSVRAEPALP